MKKSTKIATIAIITLGVASASVAYAAKSRFQNDETRAEYAVSFIAKKLELDVTQEQALSALKDQVLIAKNAMKDQMESAPDDVRMLVEAENFDQAKALELVTSKTATIDTVAPELVGALGNFLNSLDAEQKEQIIEFMNSRQGMRKRGHWRH